MTDNAYRTLGIPGVEEEPDHMPVQPKKVSGFLKAQRPPKKHTCDLPGFFARWKNNIKEGDLWRCEHCKTVYVWKWEALEWIGMDLRRDVTKWRRTDPSDWVRAGGDK